MEPRNYYVPSVIEQTNRGERAYDLYSKLLKENIIFVASTTPTLLGGASVTESHISTITDSIILLRYVEMYGEMQRGITVLKMRGAMHDKDIREFNIDGKGMHIGKPFRNVTGILSGNFTYIASNELGRMSNLFDE